MRAVGDYEWEQLSMWDFAPDNCIEKYIKSIGETHTFHFYLKRISEIVSPTHWRTEVVTGAESVPIDILSWRCDDYYIRENNKSRQILVGGVN